MKKFLERNGKLLLALLIIVLFFGIGPFGGVHTVHACGTIADGLGLCDLFAELLFFPFIFTSWLLSIGGLILNFIVEYTVVNMQSNITAITGIDIAWGTIRDVMNMSFIFILLYTAIGTILDLGSVNWKKSVINIIIAAILINFSLFFTKVIIDASNILALTFYRIIVPAGGTIKGLSDTFMQPLGLTTLYNPAVGSKLLESFAGNLTKIGIVSLGGSAFFVITAVVFIAIAIMLIIRYITFIFLLILSPVAFMGNLIPRLSSWVGKWWKTLWDQVIFAPVFFLMVWVVAIIINNSNFLCPPPTTGGSAISGSLTGLFDSTAVNGTGGSTGALCASGSSLGLLMNYIILISFIVASLVIAKQLANQGGSAGQKLVQGALGYGAAGIGFAGRRVIGGRAQARLDDPNYVQKMQDRVVKGGLSGRTARLQLAANKYSAKSSFDARGGAKYINDELGLDIGLGGKAGGKGGRAQTVEDKKKADLEFQKFLENKPAITAEEGRLAELKIRQQRELEINLAAHNTSTAVTAHEAAKTKAVDTEVEFKAQEKEMRDKADAVRTADAAVATKQREVDAMIIPEFKAQKETELAATKQEAENRKTELQIATDQAVATKKRLETDQADAKRLESIRATALEAHKITPLDGQVTDAETAVKDLKRSVTDAKIGYARQLERTRPYFILPVSPGSRQAAAEIRKSLTEKSDAEKMKDLATKIAKDDLAKEAAATTAAAAPASPPPTTPAAAPASPPPTP